MNGHGYDVGSDTKPYDTPGVQDSNSAPGLPEEVRRIGGGTMGRPLVLRAGGPLRELMSHIPLASCAIWMKGTPAVLGALLRSLGVVQRYQRYHKLIAHEQ